MARHARPRPSRKSRNSAIAVVTAGAATLTFAALRGPSSLTSTASAATSGRAGDDTNSRALATWSDAAVASVSRQSSAAHQRAHDQAAQQARDAERTRKQHERAERERAAAERADRAKRAAAKRAATTHTTHKTTAVHPQTTAAPTSKPAAPAPAPTTAAPAATTSSTASSAAYADNLDGWIKQALAIMAEHGIPGTYDGIYRNIMRESSGDPDAVNNWDSNAAAGTPSKGLLQVIQPTFDAYHVAGTSMDIMDPVANIVAACNYAAAMYGSIDNVYSAY